MSSGFRFPDDIFTEAEPDDDTLVSLGPLRMLAGSFAGAKGHDRHPNEAGVGEDAYTETWELLPIDAQTNGPQLFYGLRYHQQVIRVSNGETFHDQVGYLLWEPERGRVLMTLAIPRGQVAMAVGDVAADARTFTLRASEDDRHAGIVTNDFLDHAFRTPAWQITFDLRSDDEWSYDQTTSLHVLGREGVFAHTDRGLVSRTAPPAPNRSAPTA